MEEIDKVINDGISLPESINRPGALPLFSLGIALRAYFSTYHQVSMNFFLLAKDRTPVEEEIEHQISYYTSCFEVIIHFQHFAELVCKAFLRNDHPLLASDSAQKISIFYKLINNEPITSEEQDNLKSVEFSQSLERICALSELAKNKENRIRYNIFAKWKKPLGRLNILRNRLWHRGTFILRYPALDQFVGAYILPFVQEIVSLPEYSNLEAVWKYKPLYCGIDPIKAIINHFNQHSHYNRHEIAFLKELGNGAYKNPLWIGPLFPNDEDPIVKQTNESIQKNVEDDALITPANWQAKEILRCPVCGMLSLVNTEAYVLCIGCKLRIGAELGSPKSNEFDFSKAWF